MSVSIEEQILVTRAVLETLEDVGDRIEREERLLRDIRIYRAALTRVVRKSYRAQSTDDVAEIRKFAQDGLDLATETEAFPE
jgi:hypothetical protein